MTVRLPPRRTLIAILATLVVLTPIAFFWQQSLVPNDLSPMAMGSSSNAGCSRCMCAT